MYFILDDDSIVPVSYDQGTDRYIVKKRDFDPDYDDILSISFDKDDEEDVEYWWIDEETDKKWIICLVLGDGSESEDSYESEEEEESDYEMEDEESESVSNPEDFMPSEYGLPFQ